MTDVQKVEDAVGENEALAFSAQTCALPKQIFVAQYLAAHSTNNLA